MVSGSVLRSVVPKGIGATPGPVAAGGASEDRFRYASPEALFSAQNSSLVRALTASCGDRALAEDSVQEAFARLLVNWDRISDYDDPVTWVRRVALNLTQDHRRSLLRRARLLARLDAKPRAVSYSVEGDPGLWRAVCELPSQQRTAVSLFYLGDLKVAEVAAVMKVSEGAVKSYLDRARDALREKLEESHGF
jgi:RNA polymerase sigma-70 factor (ECF subfamily)